MPDNKTATHIGIPFERGIFIQRLEPTTATQTPLDDHEKVILKMYREQSTIKDELVAIKNDIPNENGVEIKLKLDSIIDKLNY